MSLGTVKYFSTDRGYGFIAPDSGEKDVFVHITAVQRCGLSELNEGQRIRFDIVTDQRSGRNIADNLEMR